MTDRQKAIRALSRDRGLLFTQDGHLGGSISTAHDMFGHLGPDALFSHSIDLTERDIALCQATGTRIVHNPSAVMSIRGRCPVPELLDAGVTVLLGSDGTAPDRGADMFRHMWQCMHYHRRHFRDAGVLPPGKVLEMCTIDAANGLGMGDQIGSLEVGKKADVILVDLAKPHLYPYNMPLYRLVCFASGADVDTVIINGEIVMEGRRLTRVDEMAILEDAQIATETMLDRTGLRPLLDLPTTFWGHSHY
jgi:cytosine/adenosine deaminase-related metal-dependent hydrolase